MRPYHREPRERLCSIGGSSKSSANSSQTTSNVDKRLVVDGGAIGISSDNGSVAVNVLDGGAIQAALALADNVDARSGEGLKVLAELGRQLFDESFKVLDKNTALAAEVSRSVGSAYEVAQSSVSGARDQQKILLIVGAVAVAFIVWRKR